MFGLITVFNRGKNFQYFINFRNTRKRRKKRREIRRRRKRIKIRIKTGREKRTKRKIKR